MMTERQTAALKTVAKYVRCFGSRSVEVGMGLVVARQLEKKGLLASVRTHERREWGKVVARVVVAEVTDLGLGAVAAAHAVHYGAVVANSYRSLGGR